MKTNILFTCSMLMFYASASFAQQNCPRPTPLNIEETVGIWKGSYSSDGSLEEISVEFAKMNGQPLRSYVSIPKRGMKRVEFATRICESQEIHFSTTVGPEQFEFTARLRNHALVGNLSIKAVAGVSVEEIFALKK